MQSGRDWDFMHPAEAGTRTADQGHIFQPRGALHDISSQTFSYGQGHFAFLFIFFMEHDC